MRFYILITLPPRRYRLSPALISAFYWPYIGLLLAVYWPSANPAQARRRTGGLPPGHRPPLLAQKRRRQGGRRHESAPQTGRKQLAVIAPRPRPPPPSFGQADAGGRGRGAIGSIFDAASCGDCSDCSRRGAITAQAGRFCSGSAGRFPAAARLSPALSGQERRAVARRYPAGSPARLRRICRWPIYGQ